MSHEWILEIDLWMLEKDLLISDFQSASLEALMFNEYSHLSCSKVHHSNSHKKNKWFLKSLEFFSLWAFEVKENLGKVTHSGP